MDETARQALLDKRIWKEKKKHIIFFLKKCKVLFSLDQLLEQSLLRKLVLLFPRESEAQ